MHALSATMSRKMPGRPMASTTSTASSTIGSVMEAVTSTGAPQGRRNDSARRLDARQRERRDPLLRARLRTVDVRLRPQQLQDHDGLVDGGRLRGPVRDLEA